MVKKTQDQTKNLIGLLIVGLILMFAYFAFQYYFPKPLTRDECYRLGSNERTLLCLQELEERNQPTVYEFPDLALLKISDATLEFENQFDDQPTLNATLTNDSEIDAGRVFVQIKFLNGNISCDNQGVDTVYVQVADSIFKGDSIRIKSPIETNYDTSKEYYWCATVVDAEIL